MRPRPSGFTIVELLVCIACIGIVMSLLIPAISRGIETSRRAMCGMRLTQMAIAVHGYMDAQRFAPSEGVYAPYRYPSLPGHVFQYSVHARLLPYLESGTTAEEINFSIRQVVEADAENATVAAKFLAAFVCPSEGNVNQNQRPGCSFRANSGVGPNVREEVDDPSLGGAFPCCEWLSARDFLDGMNNTVAFSEKRTGSSGTRFDPGRDIIQYHTSLSSPPTWPSIEQWVGYCQTLRPSARIVTWGGSWWISSDRHQTGFYHCLPPNPSTVDCGRENLSFLAGLLPARSWHVGGVNAAMMDGSVRWISDSIDVNLWRATGTRSGSETVRSQ